MRTSKSCSIECYVSLTVGAKWNVFDIYKWLTLSVQIIRNKKKIEKIFNWLLRLLFLLFLCYLRHFSFIVNYSFFECEPKRSFFLHFFFTFSVPLIWNVKTFTWLRQLIFKVNLLKIKSVLFSCGLLREEIVCLVIQEGL